jgi:hypothetical protein
MIGNGRLRCPASQGRQDHHQQKSGQQFTTS